MEYNYADHLDLEWESLLNGYLNSFSCQKKGKEFTYDEVLGKIFSSDTEIEQEANYRDKELCEKCLSESLNFLSKRSTLPRQSQVRFLLTLAKFTARDETCFINLTANNVLPGLLYVSKPTDIPLDKETKILFLELLDSFLEHQSGIKGLLETKYWTYAHKVTIDHQGVDEDITTIGCQFMTKLLEKAFSFNSSSCYAIIQILVGPLINSARMIETTRENSVTEHFQMIHDLKPSLLCLVKIQERLLEAYSSGVLHLIMNLKVDVASDTISKTTNDRAACLSLDRIVLILSFFKLADIFDGIKSINEDPLAITGFLRIAETETDKGMIDLVFELYYYALKYLKNISGKLPKYILKGKNLDIENELVGLQLELVLLISEKLGHQLLKNLDLDMMRMTYVSKLVQNFSFNSLQVGQKIRKSIPVLPFDVFSNSVKIIIRSRHLYSKEHLGTVFETLIYSMQDTMDYVKGVVSQQKSPEVGLKNYVLQLLTAMYIFIESFNLGWSDSVKILELSYILNSGCTAYQWPTPIVVQACKLLELVISRRLSPSMSLLIDCNEDLTGFGPTLYHKCFTTEWEVRKSALELIRTIAISANTSFSSFKHTLIEASLPHLISTMALNDEHHLVRTAAFKCLQEMFEWDDIESIIPKNPYINKVLEVLTSHTDPLVKVEVVKLVRIVSLSRDGLEDAVLSKVYRYMEQIMSPNTSSSVQIEGLYFWCCVTRKHLSQQGWLDKKFPSVTFSKRIISMTNQEVRKRVYKALHELTAIGCLHTLVKVSRFENLSEASENYLNKIVYQFNELFREHDITPESMLFNEEFEDMPHMSSCNSSSQIQLLQTSDSDKLLQEIIDDTVMKMIPDDLEFVQDEDLYSLIDEKFSRRNINFVRPIGIETNSYTTPAEFVDFVFKRIAYISCRKDSTNRNNNAPSQLKSADVYNIIDY